MSSTETIGYKYYGVVRGPMPGIYTPSDKLNTISDEDKKGFQSINDCITYMTNNCIEEDKISVFGVRGGRYTLPEWKRKTSDHSDEYPSF